MTTSAAPSLRDPFEVEPIETPDTLSQTLMARHDSCPFSAYLMRKHRGGPSSHALDRGIAYHAFHEQAVQTMIEAGEQTMPGDVATELADAVMAERKDLHLSADSQDVVRACAWNWAEATVLDLEALIGAEIVVEAEIAGWKFTCRIDLLESYESTLVVRDQKTSLAIRRKEEVERGFQGKAYALAALNGLVTIADVPRSIGAGIKDIRFMEEYPRYRTDEGPLVTREAWWDRAEIVEFGRSLERNILSFEKELTESKFKAIPDESWCKTCVAEHECPLPPHLRGGAVKKIRTPEEAEAVFARKLAVEREQRSIQSALRAYVIETEQPVIVGDHAFDATLAESKSVDWDAVAAGAPLEKAVSKRQSTKFGKRKLTEEERDAGAC